MSPEQATGDRAIDGRTDIYSLGAMTYEMLTGELPHIGSTSQAIIARVLTEKPRSIRVTRPNVPPQVEAAVEHALEKLAADRFATAREFADALAGKSAWATSYTAVQPATTKGSARPSWHAAFRQPVTAALAVALLATAAALVWNIRESARSGGGDETIRFDLVLPESAGGINMDGSAPFAISPDGRTIAYRAKVPDGASSLNVRRIDEASAREIRGSKDAEYVAFSPDGLALAYGTAWIGDEIVTGSQVGTLNVSAAAGGDAAPFASLDTAKHETGQVYPVALADGETILYVSVTGDRFTSHIGIASMASRTSKALDIQGVAPLGIIDGRLIYHDSRGTLLGVPFDLERRRVTGAPVPLVDSVTITASGGARAALSHSGSLVYLAGTAIRADAELIEVDLQGKEHVVSPLRRQYRSPRYSPDGRRIAVSLVTDPISETWIYDIRTGTLSPLARGLYASQAEWSPDGKYLAFASRIDGTFQLWSQVADGSAPATVLQARSPKGQPVHGMWSPDGQYLVYRAGYDGDDLWYRSLTGDTSSKPISAERSFVERHPDVSPDGKWVAYSSNESGTFQVSVRPFPGPGARYPVTADGGDAPKWAPDGRTLYYTNGNRMHAATVSTVPQFNVTRRTMFEHRNTMEPWARSYDLSPDGKHFLMVRPVGAPGAKPRPMVIYNWGAELSERSRTSVRR